MKVKSAGILPPDDNYSKHAAEAIRFDSIGQYRNAIQSYRAAVDCILRRTGNVPENIMKNVLLERANAYRNRIYFLERRAEVN